MNVLDLIKRHEGLRLVSYDDATGDPVIVGGACIGTLSIGYGSTVDVVPGMIITTAEAEQRLTLAAGIATADAQYAVGPAVWSGMNEARQAALTDMAYTMGRLRLLGFHMMLEAIQDGRWQRVHDQCLASKWAAQVKTRAAEDAQIFLTGEFPA